MLTQGEDVEVQALRKRGWSYIAIARHIGCDWRTVKAYVEGREPGVRRRSDPDPLERFAPYLRARFAEDPHVWGSALFDEVTELGYSLSYPSFVRQVRDAGLRPTARPAPASSAGTRSTSPTRRARRSNGTGSSAARPRGAGWASSCWAPCPTPAAAGG